MKRLDKPPQLSDMYVLARVYKYLLVKTGKDTNFASSKTDYFTFLAMYQQRLDQ
jgi:hypothetical protein